MKKLAIITFLILLVGQLAFSQNKDKTYILVHGAWHGAWCWYKVVPEMTKKGFKAIAIDLPGHGKDTIKAETVTFKMYVEKLKQVANSINGQVILVGHSMAGTIISQAAEELGKNKVFKLIYLDAFLPKNGESVSKLAGMIFQTLPQETDTSKVTFRKGIVNAPNGKTRTFKPEIADIVFYHDCNTKDKELAHKNLCTQATEPLGATVSVTDNIYGQIPKYYILCTEGKDLDKSLLPTRVKCEKVIKIPTSHSPFFSRPKELAKIFMTL
ncbi:MAG: alpha/beta fold hydrolase [Deltaproteobacteria bacterium]